MLSRAAQENDRIAISQYIEEHGVALFQLVEQNGLEGVVAKRKDSLYRIGKQTKDWVKFKALKDDDFVVLGYIKNENNMASVILGQYQNGVMTCQGRVLLGTAREDSGLFPRCPKMIYRLALFRKRTKGLIGLRLA